MSTLARYPAFRHHSQLPPWQDVSLVPSAMFRYVRKIVLIREVPDAVGAGAGEAIEGLRSVLDQSMHSVANYLGLTIRGNLYFPFAKTESDLDGAIRGKLTDFPLAFRELLSDFKTFQRQDSLLYALSCAANDSKHVKVTASAVSSSETYVTGITVSSGAFSGSTPKWDSRLNEMTLIESWDPIGPNWQPIKVTFHLNFAEVPGITGLPVVSALNHMAGEVEAVVSRIKESMQNCPT